MNAIGEVTVRELSRDTCAVLTRVRDHRRVIVTRHGHPIVVMLSIEDCIELVVAHMPPIRHWGERARAKHDLVRRLLGAEIAGQAHERQIQRMSRGRWPASP